MNECYNKHYSIQTEDKIILATLVQTIGFSVVRLGACLRTKCYKKYYSIKIGTIVLKKVEKKWKRINWEYTVISPFV